MKWVLKKNGILDRYWVGVFGNSLYRTFAGQNWRLCRGRGTKKKLTHIIEKMENLRAAFANDIGRWTKFEQKLFRF